MMDEKFDVPVDGVRAFWFERDEAGVRLLMASPGGSEGELLLRLDRKTLGDLLVWSDDEAVVSAVVTGPMARDVKKNARDLGLTDEMFVWHAVKLFVEVGENG